MSHSITPPDISSPPTQVWVRLTPDLQERAIQLLVQLALNQVRQPTAGTVTEVPHGLSSPPREDPA